MQEKWRMRLEVIKKEKALREAWAQGSGLPNGHGVVQAAGITTVLSNYFVALDPAPRIIGYMSNNDCPHRILHHESSLESAALWRL